MRAYTIKHTGKTILQNMMTDITINYPCGDKVYAGLLFFRKKDADRYLNTLDYKEYYEVIGITIDKSEKDNRKRT